MTEATLLKIFLNKLDRCIANKNIFRAMKWSSLQKCSLEGLTGDNAIKFQLNTDPSAE
jgi:hypothetical protein